MTPSPSKLSRAQSSTLFRKEGVRGKRGKGKGEGGGKEKATLSDSRKGFLPRNSKPLLVKFPKGLED